MSDLGVPHTHAEVEDNSFWLTILGLFVLAIFLGVYLHNKDDRREKSWLRSRLSEVEVTLADLSKLRPANDGGVSQKPLTRASDSGSVGSPESVGDSSPFTASVGV